MKKVVVIPDSFKGSMESQEICAIIQEGFRNRLPDCQVVSVPVADGGEGSVDCFLQALGGRKIPLEVQGPLHTPLTSFFGILPDGTAVIEMAAAAGLPLVGQQLNPELTTTYGVGQLMTAALDAGCHRMVMGLGGSATNDGGVGAAVALGARFLNAAGEAFLPTGGTLKEIASIDLAHLDPRLGDCSIVTMCDIDNPLCGPTGASAIFGPQKGADPEMVQRLDAGLAHLANLIRRDLDKEVLELPGSGAAGGMGAGMVAFFGSEMQMGIQTVLDMVGFEELARDADLVISGEGKLDTQSLRGKVIIGVARRTQALGVPLVAIVGAAEVPTSQAQEYGVTAVFTINRLAQDFSVSRYHSRENLAETVDNLLRYAEIFIK